jgi:hypothetical protein
MRVSQEKAAENRERIVKTASRMFREDGFDRVGVDAIMHGAGLIPVVLETDLLDRLRDPGVAGEAGEAAGFVAQSVPGETGGVDDGVTGLMQSKRKIALAQIKPYSLHRVEFGTIGWERK